MSIRLSALYYPIYSVNPSSARPLDPGRVHSLAKRETGLCAQRLSFGAAISAPTDESSFSSIAGAPRESECRKRIGTTCGCRRKKAAEGNQRPALHGINRGLALLIEPLIDTAMFGACAGVILRVRHRAILALRGRLVGRSGSGLRGRSRACRRFCRRRLRLCRCRSG
jgi:hypothetical protein